MKAESLIGKTINDIQVLGVSNRVINGRYRTYLACKCFCGKEFKVRYDSLLVGDTRSCGCISKNRIIPDKLREDFTQGTQLSKIKSIPTSSNKSGVVGVNWDKSRNKWQASLRYKGKKYNIGRYDNIEDAALARKEYEKMFFGPMLEDNDDNKRN